MKIAIPGLDSSIKFREEKIYILVIENQSYLFKILNDINSQINKNNGNCVLSIDDKPVDFSKHAELLTDFICFDINRKPLLTKIISAFEMIANDENHFVETNELTAKIESYIYDISCYFDFGIAIDTPSFSQIIKSCGISITDDHPTLSEKILNYMELVREFFADKLFILVNLRSFVSDDEMQLFLETATAHDFKLLLIESTNRKRLNGEKRITVDVDLCQF